MPVPAQCLALMSLQTLQRSVRDDVAYILPMAVFLLITFIAGEIPGTLPVAYIVKTILTAALLVLLWGHYTKISWSHWPLGLFMGVLGAAQWIGMERGLLHFWPNYPRMGGDIFDPMQEIHSANFRLVFYCFRLAGPALVVPVMEELFWRDFLWRTLDAGEDFKSAPVGIYVRKIFWIVAFFFAAEHVQWITAIVWAIMIGWLLVRTRSLGACIVMHGVTNFLLGVWVLWRHDWWFW
jgi:CAAX protease family protein